MKINETPQDKTALENFTKELLYAKNDKNEYQTVKSSGWDVKSEALSEAWKDIEEEVNLAYQLMIKGEKSPIYYLMIKNLMSLSILSGYTGFWKFTIKRHFKPLVFKSLSQQTLEKYAYCFQTTVEEMKALQKS